MGLIERQSNKNYLKVVGGNLVKDVEEGTEGSRKREYEVNGKKGVKHELVYTAYEGVITDIRIKETEWGKLCEIEFDGDAVISLHTDSRYFNDFACKVFNVDLKKPVVFHPYDMETPEGKKSGISLQQDGKKLPNYFYDFEKKENLHDFPKPDEKQKTAKGYWKFYFATVSEFLVLQLATLDFGKPKEEPKNVDSNGLPDVEDLPF